MSIEEQLLCVSHSRRYRRWNAPTLTGTLRDSMLGQFSRKDQSNGSLNLSGRDGRFRVVDGQFGSFGSDSFENVGNERVEDRHGFEGDTGVGVNLFEDLVDVGRVRFDPCKRWNRMRMSNEERRIEREDKVQFNRCMYTHSSCSSSSCHQLLWEQRSSRLWQEPWRREPWRRWRWRL